MFSYKNFYQRTKQITMKTIQTDSLEIFKQNKYIPTDIGMVSDNAYLSIIATNNCQCNCAYCINSETDHSLNLPIGKAILNINKLINEYKVKEAIILGGEPLLHPRILYLISSLREETDLDMIRLTTNGIKLKNNPSFIKELVHKDYGIQGINISFHNEDFMTLDELYDVYKWIKDFNSDIKVRINTNIWKGNCDTLHLFNKHLQDISFADEIRVSNIIPKDDFSVNPINKGSDLVLPDEKYISLFTELIKQYENHYTIIENKETLGFVRYLLIPAKCPIIINWNLGSKVADQVCENDIENRKINTFKCLVNGDISLSWNSNNIITKR